MSKAATNYQPHPPAVADDWWRYAVIYQVYPRSFADADGDGMGDLPGIIGHLPYLAELGVDAIWLSPFYTSPQNDGGYDVIDYRQVDPLFGTLHDADQLIEQAHQLGLRVIVDLVPNHTSSEHPWFQAALAAAPGSAERARYLFRDGKGKNGALPPNNWKSIFGSTAWTRITEADGKPGQWYLHLFDRTQPDLDWNNPAVSDEFDDILRFWLNRGVDGFRVDVAHGLVKADGLPDHEERVGMADGKPRPAPMFDQDGVHEIYRRWRRVLDEFDPRDAAGNVTQKHTRALVAEAWVAPEERLALYLRPDEMQQAFNFAFLTTKWNAREYQKVIDKSLTADEAVGAPTTWVLSNHDVVRHPSRFGLREPGAKPNGIFPTDPQPDEALGLRRARAATLFMLALPGSAYLYQGEELGLPEHSTLPDEVRQAPEFFRTKGAEAGRDGCRVPLPWVAAAPGFGFSPTGKTWLPQPASWAAYAADVQRAAPDSTLNFYRSALKLRKEFDLGLGGLTWIPGYGKDVLAFQNGPVLVLANLGEHVIKLPSTHVVAQSSQPLPETGALPPDTAVWLTEPKPTANLT